MKNIEDKKIISTIQEKILDIDEYNSLINNFPNALKNAFFNCEIIDDKEINIDYFANIIYKKVVEKLKLTQDSGKESVKIEIKKILNKITNHEHSLNIFRGINLHETSYLTKMGDLVNNDFVDTNYMWNELKKNILISEEIIIISPFIDFSSLLDLIEIIKKRDQEKKLKLKILTTTFDGQMQFLSIEGLKHLYLFLKDNEQVKLEIKIEDSREAKSNRLHSKSFIFKSLTNFGVAYVGSGNFTKNGLRTGKEWNIKITEFKEKRIFENLISNFEEIWNGPNMYIPSEKEEQFDYLLLQKKSIRKQLAPIANKVALNYKTAFELNKKREDFRLKEYQKEALDKIRYERELGIRKHLLIMATGTGKTFTAAYDFFQQTQGKTKKPTLLF